MQAQEILGINIMAPSLIRAKTGLFSTYSVRLIDKRLRRLKTIRDTIGENQFKNTNNNLVPLVFKKIKTAIKQDDITLLDGLEKRELRTLAYSLSYSEGKILSIFSEPEELSLVLFALKVRWKPSYLMGLLDCYLKNWGSHYAISNEKLGEFIKHRLNEYDGDRSILKALKQSKKYFDHKKGDLELGKTLALTNTNVNEATKYMKLPDSWLTYPYYSMVIMAYYESSKKNLNDIIDDLGIALTGHNYTVTNQRVISKLIIQANKKENADLQEKVKTMAFNFIGDPDKASSKWGASADLNENEKNDLVESKKILNHWLTLRFISVFFEKCINEPERKAFWLKIAPKITGFKVLGSRYTRMNLIRDERIAEFVNESRFASTQYGNTSALLMVVNNYVLIEFSEAGYAFYAYKKNNPRAPKLEVKYASVDLLRDGDMPMLVYANGSNNSEGRLTHRGIGYRSWQSIFTYWLKEYVRI